ncbi:hypothetical protein IMZ31_22490 (plasmid) [Pontibacillus sp. ALD_SL1]|uniref:hypothetical protein n=1 Tax=Pontibacillus sp. ALD_SL1 TaxID=2777185 RepID=UPI001A96D5AD|nr:hypothetical protein [Pontibacillus sp. ALD_SL1]QST02225.1 hypothetical protein IMZ31_22490 [Pontibacillus sp. ALD_SL1]
METWAIPNQIWKTFMEQAQQERRADVMIENFVGDTTMTIKETVVVEANIEFIGQLQYIAHEFSFMKEAAEAVLSQITCVAYEDGRISEEALERRVHIWDLGRV